MMLSAYNINNEIYVLSNIPHDIKLKRQWVCYNHSKEPISPRTGQKAKANDPATWGTYQDAVSYCDKHRGNGIVGIGYEFSADDDYIGVDLDKCRDPESGDFEQWAADIIARLESYTEISPSGTGFHVIIKGKLPAGGNRKGPLELYDSGRYFTMTGNHLPGTPPTIENRQAEIEALHNDVFGKPQAPQKNAPPGVALDLSDRELLDKALSADNGPKFAGLYNRGDWGGWYPSQSEADLGLCSMLAFWCGPDPERIDRLFRQSGLMRDKWDRRQAGSTYGRLTIEKALSQTTEYYELKRINHKGDGSRPADPPPVTWPEDEPGSEPQKEPAIIRPKLITLSGAELSLKKIPEIRWAIPGLLPEGYGLLGGRPKMGKSWLTLDYCLAVAQGGFAIGSDQYQAHGGEALYLALEDNERRLQDRQRILTDGGPGALRLHLVIDFPRLNEGGLEMLGDWLKNHPACGLVVIDTLAKVKPRLKRGVDAYEHEMESGGNLQKLASKYRICLLAVHHTRKAKPDYEDFVDELAGSTGITGAADFIMVLSRGRGADTATLKLTGKDIEETDLALKFSRGIWTLLGEAHEYNVSTQRLAILDIIKKSPDPMTPKEIADLTGISHGVVKHLISELYRTNIIERLGYGKYIKK
jgi:putative DNA primase/helicase